MVGQADKIDFEKKIISWKIPEYDKHKRGKKWYIISASIGLMFVIFSFFSGNFLFAAIIIIGAFIIITHDGQEPVKIDFAITDQGLKVGRNFYDYDVMKNFSIVYKPRENVKNLYFEFKNVVRPRLSIPIENINSLQIRENLLKYLSEDLERTGQPLSEFLAKIFKL